MADGAAGAATDLGPGPWTRVRRMADRGRYDRATVHGVLDEGRVCHLGLVVDGRAVVVPTVYGRVGDTLYVHGAPANHALRQAAANEHVCVTVSLVDGLVLARSAFHHSVNYRSVMAFGVADEVVDTAEKRRALTAIVEHLVPGRSRDARPPTDAELRATRVLRVTVTEASAKVRDGGPREEPGDLALTEVWAGVVPLGVAVGEPVPDVAGAEGPLPALPGYLSAWSRSGVA